MLFWQFISILQIFYVVTDSPNEHRVEEETEVVPANYISHGLVFLDKYTEYRIQILAFNPAGDGPRSTPVIVRTHQVQFQITIIYLMSLLILYFFF